MSIIQDYRDGKLSGTMSKEQTLEIWNEVKAHAPSLIKFINALDSGNESPEPTEEENDEKQELLEACSRLVNLICRFHVLMEYPTYSKKMNDFCVKAASNLKDISELSSTAMLGSFYLMLGPQKVKVCEGMSFYKMVREILIDENGNNDELGIFLYYLMVKDDRDSFISIRSLYLLDKYLKIPPSQRGK